MKKAVLLLILLTGCATFKVADVHYEPQTDFEFVCEQVSNIFPEASCEGLDAPIVITSRLIDELSWGSLNGAYMPGEPYIFVNPVGTNPAKTRVHETTHYVLDRLGLVTDRCEHEGIARFVAGQDTEEWKIRYGCEDDE